MNDFESIYKQYHHQLLLFSLKFVDDKQEALDIVQDVFLSIWENKKYKINEDHLRPYLFSAVKHKCYNYLKHQVIKREHIRSTAIVLREIELDYYVNGEESLIESETLQKINKAVDSLSSILKEIIVLSRFEGLKNEEIAKRLGIPIRTVETRLYRALVALKENASIRSICMLLIISKLLLFNKNKSKKVEIS